MARIPSFLLRLCRCDPTACAAQIDALKTNDKLQISDKDLASYFKNHVPRCQKP